MDAEPLVHEMTNEQLVEYIKRNALLRSSAQSRKAALVQEGVALGAKKKVSKKSSVEQALELLANLTKGKT